MSTTVSSSGLHVERRSVSIIGWLMLLSVVMLFGSLAWMFSSQRLFYIQAPMVLLSFALVVVWGLLYFINPPKWMAPFLLAMVYFTLDLTVRQGLVGGGGADMQSIIKGLIGVFLFGFGLFNGLWRVFRHPVLTLFFVYAAYATVSAMYSSARLLGIGSGLTLLGIVFVVAKSATDGQEAMRRLWWYTYVAAVIAALVSLALLAVLPAWARDLADPGAYRLRGITGSANSLGPIMAVGFLASLMMAKAAASRRAVWIHRFFGLTMIVALILTNSRSTILGLGGTLALSFFVAGNLSIIGVLLLLMVGTLALGLMLQPDLLKSVMGVFAELFARSGSVQEITSFTGRSDIWAACVKLIQDKPLFGYGLGSVRVEIPKVFYDQWGNSAATAHNFVLESMISVGLVGTLPLILLLVAITVGLWRYVAGPKVAALDTEDRNMALCAFQVMGMFWIHSLVERAFAGMASPSTVALGLCVATAAYLLIKYGQAQALQRKRRHSAASYRSHPLRSA